MSTPYARAALLAGLLLSGCATTAHYGSDRIARKDPLEKINRKVYKFDRAIDKAVLRPAAVAYTKVVPEAGRRGSSHFFDNIEEPRNFVNAVLQGKPKVALRALGRFIINSTLGVGGLADHATKMGIREQKEDFGQTFAVWGIGSGPYLVLPLLGPSTLRDTAGRGAEFAGGDPAEFGLGRLHLQWYIEYPAITGPRLLSARADLLDSADKLLNGTADEYATVRSAYLQERRSQIYDGNPPDDDDTASSADATAGPDAPAAPAPRPADPPLNVDQGPAASAAPAAPSADPARNLDPGPPAAAAPGFDPARNVDPGPVQSAPPPK